MPSSTVNAPQLPVQAVPDSTTKPKPRSRNRRKREKPLMAIPTGSTPSQVMDQHISQTPVPPPHSSYLNSLPVFPGTTSLAESLAAQHSSYFNPMMAAMEAMESTEEPVFMTNAFGSAFVNPNDAMGTLGDNQGQENGHEPDVYGDNRNKMRTKAEQKMLPLGTTQDDFDDEFAHLAAPPDEKKLALLKKKPPPKLTPLGNPIDMPRNPPNSIMPNQPPNNISNAGDPSAPGNSHDMNAPPPNAPDVKPDVKKEGPEFQSSFLNFLQGKKPETLSSVTNQAITNRPALPKYVPETRPRVVEKPKQAERPRVPPAPRTRAISSDSDFSDDEGISKTVANVISNLEDSHRSKQQRKVPPLTISIRGLPGRGGRGGRSAAIVNPRGAKNRGGTRGGGPSKNKVVILDSDDEEPLIPRERISRKSKEKTEKKRREKIEKKSKS